MAENILIKVEADNKGLTDTITLLERLGQIDKKTADEFRAANTAYQERAKVTSQAGKAVDDLGTKTVEAGKKSEKAFDGAKKGISDLDGALKSVGQAIVGAFAVEKIIAFGEESIKAFQEAEKNALLLKTAVGVNGGVQQDFKELIKQSEELQKVTIFSDDAIQKAQTAALQFGLTKKQVEELIPVLTDFASATGQDLQSALDGVLQGVNGMGRGLKIYGVSIDATQTKTERLGDITNQLTKKFDGQAKAVGETAFGAAEKYKNELDDLQEKIGKDLAPTLNSLQLFLLKTAEAFYTVSGGAGSLAVELGKVAASAGNIQASIAEKLSTIGTIDPTSFEKNFNKLKEIFKGKFDSSSVEELRKKYLELAEAQKTLEGNELTLALAKKAAIIDLLAEKSKKATGATKEEADALAELNNISKLSNADLLRIKKTLESFNDINISDEIQLIQDTIDARKKKSDQQLGDRAKNLEELHKLEVQASDDLLKTKAAENSKLAELEAEKQLKLKEIAESFAKATGNNIDAILKEFKDTGKINIEALVKLKADPKEVENLKTAINEIQEKFDTLSFDFLNKSKIDSFKTQMADAFKFVEDKAAEASAAVEKSFGEKKLTATATFTSQGDFSPEAKKKFDDLIIQIDKDKESKLNDIALGGAEDRLVIAEHTNEQISKIDKTQVVDTKKLVKDVTDVKQKGLDDQAKHAKDAAQEIIDAEKKAADERKAIIDGIVNFAQGAIDLIGKASNAYYDAQAQQIQDNKQRLLDSYDAQIQANEDLHNKNKKGDREYEKEKEKLLQQRTAAEKKADKALRKIKHDQAVLNKELAIANSVINTAVAVTANIAFPVVAALIAILGAAEIAVIAGEQIPAYAKGTEMVRGKGTETSDDVPARLSVGERVVKASTNRKYFPILSAIHNERFDPETMNNFAKMSPDAIKMLAMVDKEILKDLTTLSPVFMKHESMKPIFMKKDSLSGASSYHQTIINKPSSLDEYDISRALDRGTHLKEGTIKQLAKEIGNQVKEKKDSRKSWR